MSYMKKCLAIDPGMWCEKRLSWWNTKTYCVFTPSSDSDGCRLIGEGESAASAWKNARERLNAKNNKSRI